ncbi:uncharacterized protein A4U43_C03F4480 [Asparagus officinalis]|uniref:FAD-binding PCMH-type domain-containing protein n=1 Tax=Asparagus officinalis TaxID=4686 RepID=A0A5P1F7A6_ASPOF|nr:uncharacterized protein A4U43_C03F4480 [Asparagus officinalis]
MAERRGKNLVFAVNGERFELAKVDPAMTLLEFLRTRTRYTGAKLGCGEGGCGACVVLLSTYDPKHDKVEDFKISSCLTLLCSINLCSVTTTEGLGNIKDGFHTIHERISGFYASQCGFCTPGMCMSLFSALVNADKSERSKPPDGFSKLTVSEAEKAIVGNLCRCTGYRPIVDACKSFAADVDLEDLGFNAFWKKKKGANVKCLPFHRRDEVCTFPDFLKSEILAGFSNSVLEDQIGLEITKLDISNNPESTFLAENHWYSPNSVDDFYKLLNSIEFTKSSIEIGAAVTISKTIDLLKEENERFVPQGMKSVFTTLADHMNKVASQFVRNTASLGGNLIMAQKDQFPSDIATLLLGVGSSVCIQLLSERSIVTLEEFLSRPPCSQRTLLLSIYIPYWSSSKIFPLNPNGNTREPVLLFETHRAAPRPLGNSVAYVNAAFLAQISLHNMSGDRVLDDVRLAFGAYGTEHVIRARKVENLLVGKSITASILLEAIHLLRETIVPKEGTTHADYRSSLAVAFMFMFLRPLSSGLSESDALPWTASELEDLDRSDKGDLLLSSKQLVGYSTEYHPVGQPIKKVGVELQASGEAIYVDDIPSPKDCLYGAFIYSTKPLARIKSIDFRSTLSSQKIISFVSTDDIPEGGTNIGSASLFGSEPLFADSLAQYAGQPLGVVIAGTQRFANMGAKQVDVTYTTENLEPPILSVEEAVRRSSFFEIPAFAFPERVGDFSKGMEEADHTIISEVKLGSQHYFYVETQTALAIPDEGNCVVVYSSSQCPEFSQGVIAKCLGIPNHNVRVITRRVGGGFGGKAVRAMPVATACALAAYKLQRPVRMYLDRETDMLTVGGRHPMKINYSVGFKSNGKITALHINLLINAGISEDISPMMPHNIIHALKKYNWGAFSFDVKVCRTNLSSKSAMRGPGEVQGSFIAEAIIEKISSTLKHDPNSIREKNLHTYESLGVYYKGSAGEVFEYTLPFILDKLIKSSCFDLRVAKIKHFNSCNQWKKRGISCVPIIHHVILRPTPGKVSILNDGSIVVEVGGIELGQGLWTKVKQMVAFALGQLWSDGSQTLLERVRVIQADTLSLIQGGFTAGSTTSESSCEAVRLACNVLIGRLKDLKDRLQDQMGSVEWDILISQANLQAVNLSASTYFVPDQSSMNYLNYGAAVSEVEIDLLTGATTILRADLIYDCGQSLNPAVDLGQIEGAFVQGIGFFMTEEYLTNSDGLVLSEGTWSYKVPTVDTIPKMFNVEILNSGHHQKRVLSSKASGEPPLLLASSVHCATRDAVKAARSELFSWIGSENNPEDFYLDVPATMPVVKELCGIDNVERYLEKVISSSDQRNKCNVN